MIFQALTLGWNKLKRALTRVRESLAKPLFTLLGRELDETTLEEIEQLLYEADFGGSLASEVVLELRKHTRLHGKSSAKELVDLMAKKIILACKVEKELSSFFDPPLDSQTPFVIFVVGINGSGKTTSIAKLAHHYKTKGHSVLVAAADTFRAAAIEQLGEWAERVGVDIVKGKQGADPSAVIFDALTAAKARGRTLVLVDTAGRLHNKTYLMQELAKMNRVASKVVEKAPHATVLVLDAVTGQNGIEQATVFGSTCQLSGVMLTKVDGAAKGGVALALQKQLQLPILFLGTGESDKDLEIFDLEKFVQAMFAQDEP